MSVFFAADLHFGHEGMAIKRGFKSAEEQDNFIIAEWNKVVNKRDNIFVLGDLAMETHKHYHKISLLNGVKTVVMGNHDFPQHIPELVKHVAKVAGVIKYHQKGYHKAFLTHCPIHPSELDFRVKYNIHGHTHENNIPDPRYFCVSMEQIGYKPISYTDIMHILKTRNKGI